MKVYWSGKTKDGEDFSDEYSGVEHASLEGAKAEIAAAEGVYYDLIAEGPFFWID